MSDVIARVVTIDNEQISGELVAELVRCKDCKHWEKSTGHCPYNSIFTEGEWFCADGEKRVNKMSVHEWIQKGAVSDEIAKKRGLKELIRCKDCVYWQDNNEGYPHEGCKWREDETPDPDDFCSAGERKLNA